MFWWYEDIAGLTAQYETVEARAKDSQNVFDLSRLSNLWTLLAPRILRGDDAQAKAWLDGKTETLEQNLQRLSEDLDRPSTSLEAKSILINGRIIQALIAEEDASSLFDELSQAIDQTEHLVGFPFEPLVKILTNLGLVIDDIPAYNELFEKIVGIASKREGDIRAARLFYERAAQHYINDRPVKAIAEAGKALLKLYKNETRNEITAALFLSGKAYEDLDLLWAARGNYILAASICARSFGTIRRGLVLTVNKLKWVELRLGRVPQAMAWHELDLYLRHKLREEGEPLESLDAHEESYEFFFARLLLRTSWDQLPRITKLPAVLDSIGLLMCSGPIQFPCGDFEALKEAFPDGGYEDLFQKVYSYRPDALIEQHPHFYCDSVESLRAILLGCEISVKASTALPCIEVAECVLGGMQSFMATSAFDRAMATDPRLHVVVEVGKVSKGLISCKADEVLGEPRVTINCGRFVPHKLSVSDQQVLSQQIIEAAILCFSSVVRFRDFEADITALFKDERVGERAGFASTIASIYNVLGNDAKLSLGAWTQREKKDTLITRDKPRQPNLESDRKEERQTPALGEGAPPEGLFDPSNVAHGNMEMVTPIRWRLWERAGWKGMLYLSDVEGDAEPNNPPLLAIWFEDFKSGLEIFEAWHSEVEPDAIFDQIRIAFVRGISASKPYHYRVCIGTNVKIDPKDKRFLTLLDRNHTMTPDSLTNLNKFQREFEKFGIAWLGPAFTRHDGPQPVLQAALPIKEIRFRDAWTIGRNDLEITAIRADDDVLIPEGKDDEPVIELLRWKKEHSLTEE